VMYGTGTLFLEGRVKIFSSYGTTGNKPTVLRSFTHVERHVEIFGTQL